MGRTEEVKIRIATSADVPSIVKLLKQVWTIDETIDMTKSFNDCILNDSQFIVAEVDSKIVGSLMLHYQKKLIRSGCIYGFIEEVVVDEKYRGNQIGKKLVENAADVAKKDRCYKVILSCYPERIKFYERCKFTQDLYTMRMDL
jgi:N-acetylglutamate synthase-like GNAT family acetyltransferase